MSVGWRDTTSSIFSRVNSPRPLLLVLPLALQVAVLLPRHSPPRRHLPAARVARRHLLPSLDAGPQRLARLADQLAPALDGRRHGALLLGERIEADGAEHAAEQRHEEVREQAHAAAAAREGEARAVERGGERRGERGGRVVGQAVRGERWLGQRGERRCELVQRRAARVLQLANGCAAGLLLLLELLLLLLELLLLLLLLLLLPFLLPLLR